MSQTLENLLNEGEGPTVDYKRKEKLDDKEDLAKHLVAFANGGGGYLLFGVTNDGAVEGEEVNNKINRSLISRVSRTKCSPPVKVQYEFFAQYKKNGVTGDILMVEVMPKEEIPHAVVEGTTVRKYYLRAGDESRPIKEDEELQLLFLESDDEVSYQGHAWFAYDTDSYDIQRPYPSPLAYNEFRHFYKDISEQDVEILNEGGEMQKDEFVFPLHGRYAMAIAPLTILKDMAKVYSDSYIIQRNSRGHRHDSGAKNIIFSIEGVESQDVMIKNPPSILELISVDACADFMAGNAIAVPEDTSISVRYGDFLNSTITISRGDDVEIQISIEWQGTGQGYPFNHPKSAEKDTIQNTSFDLKIESNINSHGLSKTEYEEHVRYAENIKSLVEKDWCWNKYLESRSKEEIMNIRADLETIEEKLDQALENQS